MEFIDQLIDYPNNRASLTRDTVLNLDSLTEGTSLQTQQHLLVQRNFSDGLTTLQESSVLCECVFIALKGL